MKTLYEELSEFTGRDPWLVNERCKTAIIELAWQWPQYKDKELEFYRESELYIFDLTMYQSVLKERGFHAMFGQYLKDLNIKTMLDFGGGIGEYTILAEKAGVKTTYLEVAGSHTMGYALYRFANHEVYPEILTENDDVDYYDMIVAMDVFEHIADPAELITKLAKKCRYLICNMPGELPYGPAYPQHISFPNLSNDFELVGNYLWKSRHQHKVSIIIPTLGRAAGLQRCLESIDKLNYPKELLQVIVKDGEGTVPQKVAAGLKDADGEYIVYAANDMEFDPDAIKIAVEEDRNRGLIAFGGHEILADEGNINEHFLIHRKLISDIGGEIFDTEFHHLGCDNLLWAKAKKLGRAYASKRALVIHHHFSKGAPDDEIYQKGWSKVQEDRELLKKKLEELNNDKLGI